MHYAIIDINECIANTDDCDQGCQNTVGSFLCTCRDGYVLSGDGRTCSGKPSLLSCWYAFYNIILSLFKY